VRAGIDARFVFDDRILSQVVILKMPECVPTKFTVIIPTLNAASDWPQFASVLTSSGVSDKVLILDSSSTDGTQDLARAAGFRVHAIAREEFNHGGSRQLAVELNPDVEILIFLTQDAVLADPGAIKVLLTAFDDTKVGAAFGRQLPRAQATPIEAHARLFNYPAQSSVRTLDDRQQFGFKTIFISNSFAAYRREALMAVGGFPVNVIFGEDTVAAAKLLLSGWKITYVAEARAYHSHSYTWTQDFRRYFDIGVLHARENWLMKEFGGTSNDGGRFVQSEVRYLWQLHQLSLPSALIRTGLKLIAYHLGKRENRLSKRLKRHLSMNSGFWS
jgi:rhamnosyltransferase